MPRQPEHEESKKGGKYPQATTLVEMLMDALGIDRSEEGAIPELGRATGTDSRYLYRWFAGESRPSFDEAVRLLDIAGLLHEGVRERLQGGEAGRHDIKRLPSEAAGRGGLERQLGAIQKRLAEIEQKIGKTRPS
jgi:hypothetical protein